jgi:AbiV family abortive infection protein
VDLALVVKLGDEAANNALALVEEAELLDTNDHVARAFALTILATEELGKAFVCAGTAAHASHDPEAWEAFWTVIGGRQHEDKVFTALWLEKELLQGAGLPVDALAQAVGRLVPKDLNAAKFRALYVDLEDGRVAAPSEIAEDEDQRARAKTLRKSVTVWAIGILVGALQEPTDEPSQ